MAQDETDTAGDANLVGDSAVGQQRRAPDTLIDEVCQRSKALGRAIETRPYTSVVAALGIGLLLGKLFLRSPLFKR